jgi:hypothetical protein
MNLIDLFENISAQQRGVGQLPADFRPPQTSPQLSGPYPGRNATQGYLVGEGEERVDTLVTDTEAVMRKFKIDALPALKIVLGEREYKDRPGYYNTFIRQIIARSKQQGVAEGSRNAYLKHNNLVDIEKPLAGLKSEFEKFLQTHDPKEKQKYQQGIKQRIKSDPMSGPKGVLPEQDLAEGAKVDRMVKHVAQSEKKLGKSKDEAENIAWATANKRGMLNNKNKKA